MAQQDKGVVDWAARLRASLAPRQAAVEPVAEAAGETSPPEDLAPPDLGPLAALLSVAPPPPASQPPLLIPAPASPPAPAPASPPAPTSPQIPPEATAPPPAGLLSFLATAPAKPAAPIWASPLLAALGGRNSDPTETPATDFAPSAAPSAVPMPAQSEASMPARSEAPMPARGDAAPVEAPPVQAPPLQAPPVQPSPTEAPPVTPPGTAAPPVAVPSQAPAAAPTPQTILASRPVLKAAPAAAVQPAVPVGKTPAPEAPASKPPVTRAPEAKTPQTQATEVVAQEARATEAKAAEAKAQAVEPPPVVQPKPAAPAAAKPPTPGTPTPGTPTPGTPAPKSPAVVAPAAPKPAALAKPAVPPKAAPPKPAPAQDPLGPAQVDAAHLAVLGTAMPAGATGEGADWVGLDRSLQEARKSWRALFLGAQPPELPLAAALASRRRGLVPVVHATESDPGRFGRLLTALQAEGLEAGAARLLQAAVGADPDKLPPRGALAQDLLEREETWDYLRVGVPRLLSGLVSRALPALSARVRWLMLSPMNRGEEAVAIKMLSGTWRLVAERPVVLNLANPRVGEGPGIQLWRGPLA